MLQRIGYICAHKARWQYFILTFALLPALLVLNSCGSSTAATPSISVSCNNSSVTVSGIVQCTATILNLSSTLVNWQVNTVAGGTAANGFISTAGVYTAPSAVPTANVVTITAVAQAQTTLTGTATITITAAVAISGVTVTNSSTGAPVTTVAAGASAQFTALQSVGNPYNNGGINWYVSATCSASGVIPPTGVLGGNSVLGTFSTNTAVTSYKAPQIPPPGGVIAITAVSVLNPNQTICVTITLTFGNGSLQGGYAFSTRGRVSATNGVFVRAGSFTATGDGGLIGGREDVNPQPSGTSQEPIQFVGTYNITADGRGTMQFCEPSTSSSPSSCTTPSSFFRIVVDSARQAQIIEYSSPISTSALTVGSGEADLQDVSSFTIGSLTGTYTFGFAGLSSATTSQSEVGEFVAGGNGLITGGELDINNGGTQSHLQILNTSTYGITANGRGTAVIVTSGGTFNFSFYMVSASRAKFIETDAFPVLVGDAFSQQSIVSWGLNSLSGVFVFQTAGTGPSGGVTDLVSFTSNGSSVVAGSGTIDDNSAGVWTLASSLGGSYTLDSTGRGTLIVGTHTYVLYMISTTNAMIQETTSGIVAYGLLVQPQGGPFTLASLQTSYALSLSGTNATTGKEQDFVGQLTSNGAGTVKSGSLDVNNFGATQTGLSNIGTYATIAANGRTTMQLTQPQNLVLYFVSPTQIFVMVGNGSDTATHAVASGSLFYQF